MAAPLVDWKRHRMLCWRNRHRFLAAVPQPRSLRQVSATPPAALSVADDTPWTDLSGKSFPFLSLPGEIRNKIYDLAVPEARVVISGTHPQKELLRLKEKDPHKKHKAPRYHLRGKFASNGTAAALLFVNRQMNEEVVQYIYTRTTFCFHSFAVMRKFFNTMPKSADKSIQSLEITHRGYGEPSMLTDREWKLRHDAKWAAVLDLVKQQTALQALTLDITNFDWPIQLEITEAWARPLLNLAGEGIDRVHVKLDSDSFEIPRCEAAGKKLESKMTSVAGKKERARQEKLRAAEEKRRREESKRKATKVLTISLPQGTSSASGPPKKFMKSQGLEQYAVAPPKEGTWC